jgi:tetratricopeptide (TPR) repeat protein
MRTIHPFAHLLLGVCAILPQPAAGADPGELRAWAASVVTIDSAARPPRQLGSGVIVSEAGHVATTFSVVAGAARLRVRGHDGKTREVVGVAAANRGRELVLLATKGADRRAAVATPVDRPVAVGEPVHAFGGPGSAPMIAMSDQIDRLESGERFRRSLPASGSASIAPDQCRIVHHAYLTRASLGGGLFSDDGALLGILVPSADWPDQIHVAVHAGHLHDLIESAGFPRPLSSLDRERLDLAPQTLDEIARQREAHHLPPAECDALSHGAAVRERLHALRKDLAGLPAEQDRMLARDARWKGEEAGPQQQSEQVRRRIAANRLAIASIEPEVEILDADRLVPRVDAPLREQNERAFSPRQRILGQQLDAEYQGLLLQLAILDGERLRLQSRHAQTAADAAALRRIGESLVLAAFFAGDPLGMRGSEELEDALPELDAEIAEGRPAGVFLLLRGLLLTRLSRFDEAISDFDRLIDEDRQLRAAAQLARARAESRRRGASLADGMARAVRKNKGDPIVETLLARVALDRRDWAEASLWLRAALEHGGEAGELHTALAMVTLAAGKSPGSPRQAADHARIACGISHGTDWRAWALVGLSAAAAGDWDKAAETLDRAAPLATDFAPDTLRHWRRTVRDRKLPEIWFAP